MQDIEKQITKEFNSLANENRANITKRFFKTKKGEYAFEDYFIGIRVPDLRKIANKYLSQMHLGLIEVFLYSHIHEYRMFGLIALTYKYEKNIYEQKTIYNFYVKHIKQVNNWDLVDVSCYKILGNYLLQQNSRDTLYQYAQSKNLWNRRIAIVSTLEFVWHDDFQTTLEISLMLLNDEHDLIHKAVGWLIREVGKKNHHLADDFLRKYAPIMQKISIRYATERMEKEKRIFYLS